MRQTIAQKVSETFRWQLGESEITIRPVHEALGFTFIHKRHAVPAKLEFAHTTAPMINLHCGSTTIYTVEHLLAAFVACGITDAEIEVEKAIIPSLPLGMRSFVEMIQSAGVKALPGKQPYFKTVGGDPYAEGDRSVEVLPSSDLAIHYCIDFPKTIGFHSEEFVVGKDDPFKIASARPFRELGTVSSYLIKPLMPVLKDTFLFATPDQGILNSSSLSEEEAVKHKIIDFLGALALLGHPVRGKFNLFKSGHAIDISALKYFIKYGHLRLTVE